VPHFSGSPYTPPRLFEFPIAQRRYLPFSKPPQKYPLIPHEISILCDAHRGRFSERTLPVTTSMLIQNMRMKLLFFNMVRLVPFRLPMPANPTTVRPGSDSGPSAPDPSADHSTTTALSTETHSVTTTKRGEGARRATVLIKQPD
jgi:hypothetical protein